MKNLLPLSLIILLLIAFLLFWDAQPEYFIQRSAKKGVQQPEAPKAESYMRGVEMNSFSKTGAREYHLVAKDANFFKGKNFYTVTQPELTSYDEEHPDQPWELTADTGKLYNNTNKIELSSNVRMWQFTGLDELKELTTPTMTIFPDKKLAQTQSRVKISTPRGITHGTGMKANFSKQTFTLLKEVSGVHYAQ